MKQYSLTFLFMLSIGLSSVEAQQIPQWKIYDLKQFMDTTSRPTIINFWASWCKPCLEELPYFQKLVKENEATGLQLILVNLDMRENYPKKITSIVSRFKLKSPVVFLDETDADIFCPAVDKSWSGAIPATLFLDNTKGYRKFFEDQLSEPSLKSEIQKLIATE